MRMNKNELTEIQRNQLFSAAVRLLDQIQNLESQTLIEDENGELVSDPDAAPLSRIAT